MNIFAISWFVTIFIIVTYIGVICARNLYTKHKLDEINANNLRKLCDSYYFDNYKRSHKIYLDKILSKCKDLAMEGSSRYVFDLHIKADSASYFSQYFIDKGFIVLMNPISESDKDYEVRHYKVNIDWNK